MDISIPWVVELREGQHGQLKVKKDTKYVRAKTREGAIQCAKDNSFLTNPHATECRPATPQDLGCVKVER